MRRRVPDNSLARRLVGFEPTTPLDEVIRRVANARTPDGRGNEAMSLMDMADHTPGRVSGLVHSSSVS